jgi:hypothetical protein
MPDPWTHDALAEDLATHLRGLPRRMCWTNMPMGPMGSVRPDVFVLFKSFSRPLPTSYEVKVSMSDFRADVGAGKWQEYLAFSGAVVFAVPCGLLAKTDVPAGCGLIVRSDKAWRTVKAHVCNPVTLGEGILLKLLMAGIDDLADSRMAIKRRVYWNAEWESVRRVSQAIGADAGRYLANKKRALEDLAGWRRQAAALEERCAEERRRMEKDAPKLLLDLCRLFDVAPGAGIAGLDAQIRRRAHQAHEQHDLAKLEDDLRHLVGAFDRLRGQPLLRRPAEPPP